MATITNEERRDRITAAEAQEILGVGCVATVYRLARNGQLPRNSYYRVGRSYRFRRARLIEFVENGGSIEVAA